MSQQEADVPRFVQVIGRYRALVGIMVVLGLLGGAIFAAVNPPVFTSQALVLMAPPSSCPVGAICGGPAFSLGYRGPRLLQSLPRGVQIKFLPGNYLSVTATGGTPAQAEATAEDAAISYLSYAVSLSYPGWPGAARILEPATSASGTAPMKLLFDDALLGAVFGLLLGVIAALAGGWSTIDAPAVPAGYDVGA